MIRPENYFDHAATCPMAPEVVDEVTRCFREDFGNPDSLHQAGRSAAMLVEQATTMVASLIGCAPEEIVFTSGATESNNVIVNMAGVLAVSPFEHSAMRLPASEAAAEILRSDGWTPLPPERTAEGDSWLSVMSVSNESGAIIEAPSATGYQLHSDMTQSLGKLPTDLEGVAAASFSAHKLYGPKGIGALFVRDAMLPKPYVKGGSQQMGRRAGTVPAPLIAGFGVACAVASDRMESDYEHAQTLRAIVLERLQGLSEWVVIEAEKNSPYILAISFPGIQGEAIAVELDNRGFAISSGPACSASSTEPSPALLAAGYDERTVRGVVRISFGRSNTRDSARSLGQAIREAVASLR